MCFTLHSALREDQGHEVQQAASAEFQGMH